MPCVSRETVVQKMGDRNGTLLAIAEHFIGTSAGGVPSTVGRLVIRPPDYACAQRRSRYECAIQVPFANLEINNLILVYWSGDLLNEGLVFEDKTEKKLTTRLASRAVSKTALAEPSGLPSLPMLMITCESSK